MRHILEFLQETAFGNSSRYTHMFVGDSVCGHDQGVRQQYKGRNPQPGKLGLRYKHNQINK